MEHQKICKLYTSAIRLSLSKYPELSLKALSAEVLAHLPLELRMRKLRDLDSHQDSVSTRLSEMIQKEEVERTGRAKYGIGRNG